ncbi:pyruvate dehydrogenase complex dehydrogenase (E1) component [Streptomyces sp. SAI-144]|nr:pyruvate dehydrogenase complex dehydrogenase (E1) component [Streptomyces sp. SAI-144]
MQHNDDLGAPRITATPTSPTTGTGLGPGRRGGLKAQSTDDADVLRSVSRRVLWLSAAIVDAANRGRPNSSGVKVGGHQASSASMVDIRVALWFHCLGRSDRFSVKPHASPVLHAINYLLPQGRARRRRP